MSRGKSERPSARASTQKITLAAGSLSAIYLLPTLAHGAVMFVSGSPVSLGLAAPEGAEATWDVDGANGADFRLWRIDAYGFKNIFFASQTGAFGAMNGRGLVAPTLYTDNVQALRSSFRVGPNVAPYAWGLAPFNFRTAMQKAGTIVQIGYDFNYGFLPGDNYMGFRFLDGASQMHYGWATINFDLTAETVTIKDWAYETNPDAAIHVPDKGAQIPEPSSLALLALGAGGLAALRSRRQRAA